MNEMKCKEARRLKRRERSAKSILNNKDKYEEFLEKASSKKIKQKMRNLKETIKLMLEMVKSYVSKEYTKIPLGTIVAVVCALVYWISPVDALPDVIPFVGYIDDATVIMFCINGVKTDMDDYKEWRDSKVLAE